jgi:excisionase family DNA binding protein
LKVVTKVYKIVSKKAEGRSDVKDEVTIGTGEILTFKEAEKYLKIPRSTLYKLLQEGRLPACKVGRHWRFVKEELDDWLKASEGGRSPGTTRLYCWQFLKKQGEEGDHKCPLCIVYRSRSLNCFHLREETTHQKVRCVNSCVKCVYYQKYFG